MHRPTAGSYGTAVSDERGTPVGRSKTRSATPLTPRVPLAPHLLLLLHLYLTQCIKKVEKSTPYKKRELNILISNSEQ